MDDLGSIITFLIIIISAIVQFFTKKDDGDSWSEEWTDEWEDEPTQRSQASKQSQLNDEYQAWRQEEEAREKAQRHQELLAQQQELKRQQELQEKLQSRSLHVLDDVKEQKESIIQSSEISDKNSSILSQLKLDDKEELRRAIILKNILDKPKALQ